MILSEKAKNFAVLCHQDTNHFYDEKPYHYHLQMVADFAVNYMPQTLALPEQEIVIASAWCHDVIEDTRRTYNDVKAELGEQVADIVYALTNEKGKNRSERANDKYYAGIVATPFATFVKLCDRAANASYNLQKSSTLAETYRKEHPNFIAKLQPDEHCNEIVRYLHELFQF